VDGLAHRQLVGQHFCGPQRARPLGQRGTHWLRARRRGS
jgi:hypothetical protein